MTDAGKPAHFAFQALRALMAALDSLPDSDRRAELVDRARECQRAVERWHEERPATEDNERIMRRILGLHVEAAKLGRRKT